MKPLIGIIASMEIDQKNYHVSQHNVNAITRAGGIPIILPFTELQDHIEYYAQMISGLYAIGGDDVNPIMFGEEPHLNLGPVLVERDQFEFDLIKRVIELNKPFFGVCRGAQILNVAFGGTMYQDIYSQIDRELIQHTQKAPKSHGSHSVNIAEDSLLHRLSGEETLMVNSWHHQANRQLPSSFNIAARANDGVIEALESSEHSFVLGVQWHPEIMATNNDQASLKIYEGFIEACKEKAEEQNENN